MKYDMKLISRDELKSKLERKDHFKLVMALGTWEYRAKHIPGSLHFLTPEEALASLVSEGRPPDPARRSALYEKYHLTVDRDKAEALLVHYHLKF